MQLHHVEELERYLDILRRDEHEVRGLSDEFLITVTDFFRDPEVFEILEKTIIPALLAGRRAEAQVRLWSIGCATGEEAYSLAILLLEAVGRHPSPPQLQIFASDLHERSLQKAREGFYSVTSDRRLDRQLRQFFSRRTPATASQEVGSWSSSPAQPPG
jgi:two-component system CheB/CheR fusion protein